MKKNLASHLVLLLVFLSSSSLVMGQTATKTTPKSINETKPDFNYYFVPLSGSTLDPQNPRNTKPIGNVSTSVSSIDSDLVDITWCGENKNTIFYLTAKKTLYRSEDDVFTGHLLSDHLKKLGKKELAEEDGAVGDVESIVRNPTDPNMLLVMGTKGINWITEDCGKNFRAMNQGKRVDRFLFHPFEREWVLASAWTACEEFKGQDCVKFRELFVSKDLGKTWDFVSDYVFDFSWGVVDKSFHRIPKERIIILHNPKLRGNQTKAAEWSNNQQVSYTDDLGKGWVVAMKEGVKFLLTHDYLFIVKLTEDIEKEVKLFVANPKHKRYSPMPIEIPLKKVHDHGYTVLDANENAVFLHVDHDDSQLPYGNLYISDSTGLRFNLALKNNVRDLSGQCDFERVKGLEGIFLTNVYEEKALKRYAEQKASNANRFPVQAPGGKKTSNMPTLAEAQARPDTYFNIQNYKKTMITFDKGGIWQPLTPPVRDVYGKRIVCAAGEECSLHLHSISNTRFGPFYSTENSLGLLLGTGNVGAYLSNRPDEVNTYLSRDGGLNWYEVAKGSFIYEVGDHGGLIVMAPDQLATKKVYYSWDEGMTWEELQVSEKEIEITNIVIEPTNIGEKFVIYGREFGNTKGFVGALDFSTLHQRICKGSSEPNSIDSDYETWTPNGRISPYCLMGKQVTYVRRKRESQCFNDELIEAWKSETICQCTEEDWECDYGFSRQGSGPCLPDEGRPIHPPIIPSECEYYYVSQGYRKISGDVCEGGVNHELLRFPCAGNRLLSAKNLKVLFGFTVIVLLLVWMNRSGNTERVKEVLGGLKGRAGEMMTRNPAKFGYSNKIPSTLTDDDNEFSNVIFDEDAEDDHELQADDNDDEARQERDGRKMTEGKAMENAKKHVPLLNRPGDKKHS